MKAVARLRRCPAGGHHRIGDGEAYCRYAASAGDPEDAGQAECICGRSRCFMKCPG